MPTLLLDVPASVAQRWDALTEEERQRQVAAMIETIKALDTTETPQTAASQGRTLADAILEALGPEFAPDFTRTGTSDTARQEDFSDMDINGKFRR